jgi:hypothetical protein
MLDRLDAHYRTARYIHVTRACGARRSIRQGLQRPSCRQSDAELDPHLVKHRVNHGADETDADEGDDADGASSESGDASETEPGPGVA